MEVLNSFMTWIFKSRLGQIDKFKQDPHEVQKAMLFDLLEAAKHTQLGKAHHFGEIKSYADFAARVPLFDYESFTPYLEKTIKGKQHIFWHSTIQWFAKSSGTTAGRSKYIPVSEESLEECHYKGGKDMVSLYVNNYPDTKLFTGKSLSVGGTLEKEPLHPKGTARAGDVSALIMHNLPIWVQFVRTPSLETALMADWEAKIERMARETMDENVTSIAGVPTWTIVLLQRILDLKKASHILEVWPNLEVFFHGAVAFGPYRNVFKQLIPSEKMRYMETYNASAKRVGSGFDKNPSPGNIKDGLLTDAIKSCGAAKKGGTSTISDVLDYPEYIKTSGLNLLCTPGNDVESTTALAGSGANLILFTTGLGTPTGNPISPVIKVSSNTKLAEKMPDIIDFNAGTIISGEDTPETSGEKLLELLIEVASGRMQTKAEEKRNFDFIPWKRGVSL